MPLLGFVNICIPFVSFIWDSVLAEFKWQCTKVSNEKLLVVLSITATFPWQTNQSKLFAGQKQPKKGVLQLYQTICYLLTSY